MNPTTISGIQRRTADEADAQITLRNRAKSYSLRELINAKLPHALFPPNERSVSAAYEASELCRQHSGECATGIWVPFSMLASRDLTAGGTTAATVGVLGNKLQAALAPESAVFAGATVLSGLTGSTFGIPGVDVPTDTAGTWVTEGVAGLQREPTFKSTALAPKSLIVQMVISRRLMQNSSVDLETELRAEILRRIMLEIDRAALNGSGGSTPSGLLQDPNLTVLSAGTNGLAPTWAHLVEAEYSASTRTGSMRNPTFLTSPAMRKKLRTTQRAAGLDFIVSNRSNEVMGQPLRVSALVPDNLTKGTSTGVCSALVFGDLAEVVIGFWGPLAVDLLVDAVTQAKDGRIRLIAKVEVGTAVRNIGAFAAYKDLLSA
jgi:HK97 family phage major capsid protein